MLQEPGLSAHISIPQLAGQSVLLESFKLNSVCLGLVGYFNL